MALSYLEKSLELEMQDPMSEQLNLAGTHLNITAIMTKLGRHKEAITHAKSSIIIMRRLIDKRGGEENKGEREEASKNLYLTEAIAYYNLGASYEHLGES